MRQTDVPAPGGGADLPVGRQRINKQRQKPVVLLTCDKGDEIEGTLEREGGLRGL